MSAKDIAVALEQENARLLRQLDDLRAGMSELAAASLAPPPTDDLGQSLAELSRAEAGDSGCQHPRQFADLSEAVTSALGTYNEALRYFDGRHQDPSATLDDVTDRLLDVAARALAMVEHFDGEYGRSPEQLAAHVVEMTTPDPFAEDGER